MTSATTSLTPAPRYWHGYAIEKRDRDEQLIGVFYADYRPIRGAAAGGGVGVATKRRLRPAVCGPTRNESVPVFHRRERRAESRRVDDPVVSEVDAHVAYLSWCRPGAAVAEESDVAGLERVSGNARRACDLAAHGVTRSPPKRPRESGGTCVRLELVYAPYQAGAVEASREHLAGELLRTLGGSRPDVRRPDEAERARDDSALPVVHVRHGERRSRLAGCLQFLRRQRKHACDRVRGLRARRGLRELELESLARSLMVDPQAEHPSDRLGAEPGLRGEPCIERGKPDLHGRGAKPNERDQSGVELAYRHGPIRVDHRDRASKTRQHRCELSRSRGSSGLNSATDGAMRPISTSAAICGAAHERRSDAQPPSLRRPRARRQQVRRRQTGAYICLSASANGFHTLRDDEWSGGAKLP